MPLLSRHPAGERSFNNWQEYLRKFEQTSPTQFGVQFITNFAFIAKVRDRFGRVTSILLVIKFIKLSSDQLWHERDFPCCLLGHILLFNDII